MAVIRWQRYFNDALYDLAAKFRQTFNISLTIECHRFVHSYHMTFFGGYQIYLPKVNFINERTFKNIYALNVVKTKTTFILKEWYDEPRQDGELRSYRKAAFL